MSSGDFGGHEGVEGLTPKVPPVHSTTTPDEEFRVQTDAFLDALADVALSVAKRTLASGGEGEAV